MNLRDVPDDVYDVAGLLIGVPEFGGRHPERAEGSVLVAPGSLLLLYTDGVVDVPGLLGAVGGGRYEPTVAKCLRPSTGWPKRLKSLTERLRRRVSASGR